MDLSTLNLPAVAVAALMTFVIGGAWYSPMLFGTRWQALMGLSDETLGQNLARVFGFSLVLALVMAVNLALFIGPTANAGTGLAAGAAAGVGWVAAAIGTTYLFGRRPLALFAIDAGYYVVSFSAMGALLGAWH